MTERLRPGTGRLYRHGQRVGFVFVAGLLATVMPLADVVAQDATQDRASAVPEANRNNPYRTGRTLVIPHAGGDGLFPENTLYAYDRALALGGDVVDIDIQVSADLVPMVIHDPTLDRTTNGAGRVSSKTAAAIAKLDAGYRFKKGDAYPFRGRGIRVPTLEAVLRRYPKRLAVLDLKDQRLLVVDAVCKVLRKSNRAREIYVGIDTNEQVREFRRSCPEVRTSGTDDDRARSRAARESRDLRFVSTQLVSQPRYVGDDGTPRVTADSLAWSHRFNTAVLTYVIDDPKVMAVLIDLGVDGFYTRRPDIAVKVRRERERAKK